MDSKAFSLFCVGLFALCCHSVFSETPAPTTSAVSNATTSSPTTPKPAPSCEALNTSCGACTDDSKCFWCASDSTCKKYPASKIIPRDCKGNKWYFQQCFAPGYIVIIVIPSVAGAILLALGCCIYCCCCRSKGSSGLDKETRRIRQRREEARQKSEARRAERQKRTDAIRQKYGLLTNEDDNEVV
ncbi:pituitary tumor-transforming gene 1 protein-interacting protein [Exaiptasia diaphana]|uniref:PTTG1IP n=1 Tax=Exaiptasia diaphana TaxID=2652724 RepID=A0A913Y9A5_EXADI|nr:pituitary tumor-transforming gene 1 protein-interacting protein [Exaiptasia diaphana]KXJ21348.1 Pituitary tumor-transforming gene 1 protein-interacting protein [Exaiptasia diaphana]